jgi:hypothetical protein
LSCGSAFNRVEIGCEADAAALCLRRRHQLAHRGQNRLYRVVVVAELALELVELLRECRVGGERLAQLDEGADDVDPHLNGARAVQHVRGLNRAVLGEGVR